eukprot:GFUD01012596.1.p1 GENE.GFUD01012596.1~~GFUD01012596.1.p1  ORF type:complete len:2173 (+),score=594.82 GFUD01012596.1:2-6520(+)
MDKVHSHFYHMLLSLGAYTPKITLTEEINTLLTDIKSLQFSPSKKPVFITKPCSSQVDVSILENWRLPDLPTPSVLTSLHAATTNLTSQNSSYHRLMLGVRESYTSRGGVKVEKMKFDNEARVVPSDGKVDVTAGKLEKKLSTLSTVSTASLTSSGARELCRGKGGRLNLSRGEVLRQLGKGAKNSVTEAGDCKTEEVNSATFVKESVLSSKARAAADMIVKMGDPRQETDDLIDSLAALKNSVVTGTDDLVLAGYAEACVSVLLKHLDTVGVCKTSLEEVVTSKLLLEVPTVAKLFSQDPKLRVAQHKVQVLLRAEVHWLLASQAKQQQYEDSILAHLRQISLHGGNAVMTGFLSIVLMECYVDRQPELLSLLYDELDQERPRQLAMLFSPSGSQPPSAGPSSNLAAPGSHGAMAPPPVFKPASNKSSNLTRSFKIRPKSFDTSLIRQINIGVGKRERKNLKVVTTGRMITKSKLSAKKKLLPHKSPKKTKQMVKRNLTFDDGKHRSPILPHKSPRKNLSITTPSKVRKFTPHKSKLTPGKQHRVLCPETPNHKVMRRKSDGNTSIAETPDKGNVARTITTPRRQQASLALRRRASFYSGPGSRNVQKFEDSFNASLITGNMSTLEMNTSTLDQSSVRRDSTDSTEFGGNKSFVLFPHLLNRKRKRDDSLGGLETQGLNSSMADHQTKSKMPRMDTKSPVKKVKRRLNSFSEPAPFDQHSILARCNPTTSIDTVTSQTSFKPLESTCISGKTHLGHHMDGQGLNLSNIPNINKTPKKGQKTPMKNVQLSDDFFSPSKKVQFNMAPQPPTPKIGVAAKSILKTPLKIGATPTRSSQTPSRHNLSFKTPVKIPSEIAMKLSLTPKKEVDSCESTIPASSTLTPSKTLGTLPLVPSPLTTHCSSRLTPGKSPARRDICLSSGRSISLSKQELIKTPVKTPSKSSLVSLLNSPIIKPTKSCVSPSKQDQMTVAMMENESQDRNRNPSTTSNNHGFSTPSPTFRSKREALANVTKRLSQEAEPLLVGEPSIEQHFLPPMMSTLQNPPKVGRNRCLVKESVTEENFLPNMASTEQDFGKFLPAQTNIRFVANMESTLQHVHSDQTTNVGETMSLSGSTQSSTIIGTQDIINSTSLVDMSSTIIKLSSKIPANIFDHSALYPAPINTTVTGIAPLSPSDPTHTHLSPLSTPTKQHPPVQAHHIAHHSEGPEAERIPVKFSTQMERTPVKFSSQSIQELELVSPAKRVGDNIVRNLDSDEEEDDQTDGVLVSENVRDEIVSETDNQPLPTVSSKFRKADSEHSLAASSDRVTPEPHPSSGYSSEPHPDPPSPGYSSDHSSPGKVQVSSPPKPANKQPRTETEAAKLQDKLSGFFSPVGNRRRRKNRLETLKDVDANDEIVNESVQATPPKNGIALHSDSPLADVQDEVLPHTPVLQRRSPAVTCRSAENVPQPKIKIPRELSGLNDLMSPFFSTGEGKRKSVLRGEITEKPVEKKTRDLKRRQSVAGEMLRVTSREKKPRRQSMKPVRYREESEDSQTDEEELVRMIEDRYGDKSDSDKESDVPDDDYPEPNIECKMDSPEKSPTPLKSEEFSNSKKLIILQSPARFKCDYCDRKFKNRANLLTHQQEELEEIQAKNVPARFSCDYCSKKFKNRANLLDHQQEELEQIQAKNVKIRNCVICRSAFDTVEQLATHAKESTCKIKRPSEVTTLDLQANQEFNIGKARRSPDSSRTPKVVAELQDKLSGYYSPSASQSRIRKVPERLVEVYSHQAQNTPRSSKVQNKKFFRTKTFLQEAAATSTPNEGRPRRPLLVKAAISVDTPTDFQSSRRRSVRDRNISYADFPDFDSSNTESDITVSPEVKKQSASISRKKFVLASSRSPVRSKMNAADLVDLTLSPTFSNHSMMTLSPSVTKHFKQRKKRGLIVKNLNDSQEIQDVSSALDESQEIYHSPVKTPTKSPSTFMSPGKYFSIAKVTETPTGEIRMKFNRITKPHQPSGTPLTSRKLTASKRSPEIQPKYKNAVIIPRLNRSACKEIGLSPNKLQSIIAASPRREGSPANFQRTPEKENKPSISETCRKILKREHQVNKTPRIRIKKVPSGNDSSDLSKVWKAETVFSPMKNCSPLKSLPSLACSPSRGFSALTSGSIHKLTMSPIIHTQVTKSSRDKKRKKVNKQLAYA